MKLYHNWGMSEYLYRFWLYINICCHVVHLKMRLLCHMNLIFSFCYNCIKYNFLSWLCILTTTKTTYIPLSREWLNKWIEVYSLIYIEIYHDDVIKWNIFRVTGHLCREFTGEFPAQRPVTRSCDVFLDLRLYKRLNKQSSGWWF